MWYNIIEKYIKERGIIPMLKTILKFLVFLSVNLYTMSQTDNDAMIMAGFAVIVIGMMHTSHKLKQEEV